MANLYNNNNFNNNLDENEEKGSHKEIIDQMKGLKLDEEVS